VVWKRQPERHSADVLQMCDSSYTSMNAYGP
jgi:hypothetical protein